MKKEKGKAQNSDAGASPHIALVNITVSEALHAILTPRYGPYRASTSYLARNNFRESHLTALPCPLK